MPLKLNLRHSSSVQRDRAPPVMPPSIASAAPVMLDMSEAKRRNPFAISFARPPCRTVPPVLATSFGSIGALLPTDAGGFVGSRCRLLPGWTVLILMRLPDAAPSMVTALLALFAATALGEIALAAAILPCAQFTHEGPPQPIPRAHRRVLPRLERITQPLTHTPSS